MFSHLEKADSNAYLISLLCFSTGARWGEAQNISITDLRNSSVTYKYTKPKKSRTLPLQASLYNQLVERLGAATFNDSYSTFARRLYDSGIELPKGQQAYILRHTFVSHFMINGGNILVLKEVLSSNYKCE